MMRSPFHLRLELRCDQFRDLTRRAGALLLIGLSLGALGGGGSILAVPVLVYAAGQRPGAATTTSRPVRR